LFGESCGGEKGAGDRIYAIRRRQTEAKAALVQARKKAANRAEVAVLEGKLNRIQEALTTLERLTVRIGADGTTSSHEVGRRYDELFEQIRKGFSELDAGLARLAREGAKARREQAASVPRAKVVEDAVAAVGLPVRHGEETALESVRRIDQVEQNVDELGGVRIEGRRRNWAAVLIGALVLVLFAVLKWVLSGN
jgi:hypothetical protein